MVGIVVGNSGWRAGGHGRRFRRLAPRHRPQYRFVSTFRGTRLAVVVGPGFIVLLPAFRSVAVPATAAALNLLSVAAAYGVVTSSTGLLNSRDRDRRHRRQPPARR
ncbi:MAG: hypothetical protein JF602_09825 [Gemmatimonadetes bacterium]|nr:hypothetical protein [Gemmatimonadota bacterium]